MTACYTNPPAPIGAEHLTDIFPFTDILPLTGQWPLRFILRCFQ